MSRWTSKNRAAPSFAFPLDSLVKEKENTNRPVAARSAGTVGKWGTTSFTSIRTPSYGYAFKAPTDQSGASSAGYNPSTSPLSTGGAYGDGSTASGSSESVVATSAPAPKLKKFFKSRNTAPPPPPVAMPLPQHAEQYPLHIAAAAAAAAAGAPAGAFLPAVSYPESQHEIYQQSGAAAHLNPQHLLYPPQIPAPMADAVDASAIAAPPLPPQRSSKAAPKIRLKINKKQLAAAAAAEAAAAAVASVAVPQDNEAAPEHPNFDSYAALPAQTMPPQPVAAAKTSASSAKAASKKAPIAPKVPSEPTRKLGRARKVVNYSEARSRSPSPARTTAAAAAADPDTAAAAAAASTNGAIRVVDEPEPTGSNECRSGGEMSPSKEHPPIKLRIFKGTAQLVRTTEATSPTTAPGSADEATTNNTPLCSTTPADAIQSTAELLALLTDDSPAPGDANTSANTSSTQRTSTNVSPAVAAPIGAAPPTTPTTSTTSFPATNCIKIKIKTNYAHMISETEHTATGPDPAREPVAVPLVAVAVEDPVPITVRSVAVVARPAARTSARATRKRGAAAAAAAEPIAEAAPPTTIDAPAQESALPLQPDAMDTSHTAIEPVPSGSAVAQRRTTRRTNNNTNNNNGELPAKDVPDTSRPTAGVQRSYGRKRKVIDPVPVTKTPKPDEEEETAKNIAPPAVTEPALSASDNNADSDDKPALAPMACASAAPTRETATAITPTFPAAQLGTPENSNDSTTAASAVAVPEVSGVKLVISKKKGSIFKSRAASAATATGTAASAATAAATKRHQLYRHKWDHDASVLCATTNGPKPDSAQSMDFGDDDDGIVGKAANTADGCPSNGDATGDGAMHNKALRLNAGHHRASPYAQDAAGPTGLSAASHPDAATSSSTAAGSAAGGSAGFSAFAAASNHHHFGANNDDDDDDSPSGGGGGGGGSLPLDHWPAGDDFTDPVTSVRCDTSRAKHFYTRVRNVKKAHQIQEIGEFQEMDDDVVYILDALQPHNPTATRCLAALQLAAKCQTPAFRMHVRAHGTIAEFFRALRDAPSCDRRGAGSLALCTAVVMFVLNQDNLNVDLDRESLALMLALLDDEGGGSGTGDEPGAAAAADESGALSAEQRRRNTEKVRELCADIKAQGKATHLRLAASADLSASTLAMETLLSLTAKRTGDWFKEEMRCGGGLDRVMSAVCDGCEQIELERCARGAARAPWTAALVERLRRVERCLRVVENVSTQNEENQRFMLDWQDGKAVRQLLRFFALCDAELAAFAGADGGAEARRGSDADERDERTVSGGGESAGTVLREALVPTMKVLINLTHPFGAEARGSAMIGAEVEVFASSLHVLLHVGRYVAEQYVFELNILVLLLLMNLTTYTTSNRRYVMEMVAPAADSGNKTTPTMSTIRALVEYFYRREEMAQQVEQNTDAILDTKGVKGAKGKSQEEVEETVTKLLQKAGNHMEHTMLASYVSLLIGYLVMDAPDHQRTVRRLLRNGRFTEMVLVLEKYYNFMNLTASSEASVVAHIKQTKMIMEYFKRCDKKHSDNNDTTTNGDDLDDDDDNNATDTDPVHSRDDDAPLTVARAPNAPMQYRSSRRAAAASAAGSSTAGASTTGAMYKPYR